MIKPITSLRYCPRICRSNNKNRLIKIEFWKEKSLPGASHTSAIITILCVYVGYYCCVLCQNWLMILWSKFYLSIFFLAQRSGKLACSPWWSRTLLWRSQTLTYFHWLVSDSTLWWRWREKEEDKERDSLKSADDDDDDDDDETKEDIV